MDKIKFYETPFDPTGEHREYVVYKENNIFVFDCYEWSAPQGHTSAMSRKQHREFDNEEEAINEYKKYLSAWEDKVE